MPQKPLQVPAFDICGVSLWVTMTVTGALAAPGVLQAVKTAVSLKRPLVRG